MDTIVVKAPPITMAEAQMDNITRILQDLTLAGVIPLHEELGRGAYGKVFKVKYCSMICAAKEIHSLLVEAANPEEKRKIKDSFLRECYHCSSLRHPNIVRFIGVYYPERDSLLPAMLMELMDDSLTNYVKKPNIGMKRKTSILYDVTLGLSYLHGHDPPIIHRDLSPNNILMSRDSVAKISDLGVAKVVQADSKATKSMLTKAPGTVDFMPPEALKDNPVYGTSLDVFSYGGIVLHVVNQEWPTPTSLAEYDPKKRRVVGFDEVQRRQKYLDKMTGEAKVLKALVKACLHNDPTKRPVIAAVFKALEPLKVCCYSVITRVYVNVMYLVHACSVSFSYLYAGMDRTYEHIFCPIHVQASHTCMGLNTHLGQDIYFQGTNMLKHHCSLLFRM